MYCFRLICVQLSFIQYTSPRGRFAIIATFGDGLAMMMLLPNLMNDSLVALYDSRSTCRGGSTLSRRPHGKFLNVVEKCYNDIGNVQSVLGHNGEQWSNICSFRLI